MAGMRRVVLCEGASTDILGAADGDGLQDPPRWQAVAISCSPLEGDCRQSVDKTTPGPIGPAFFFCFSRVPIGPAFFFLFFLESLGSAVFLFGFSFTNIAC
jgi:hypothetical protein